MSAPVTGLSPGTTYHFRISATNAGGTSKGADETLKTTATAPTVETKPASPIAQTTATLNATVNPNGAEVSECKFEYGTTNSYGSSASCSSLPGSGTSAVAVSAPVTGLSANTTYHFRISATNAGATSKGADETFKTLPSLTVTTASLPEGSLGVAYSQTLAASGGTTPYSWSITIGALPAGLSLNAASGAITGTPTAAGVSNFTVKVTDSSTPTAQTATANLSVTVTQPTYTTSLTHYENPVIGLAAPNSVAVDPSGNIFVADSGHSRIVEFNAARKYVRQFGEAGTGVGQFSAIGGIATNAAGDLYVTDSPNNRVEEFGPTGEYIRTFGSSFLASGQLLYPGAVAVDSSGNVWVLNPYGASTAGHVVEFSSSGSFLSKFGASGSAEGQLGTAFGLAFSGGHLYVSEAANSRVQEFSTAGAFIAQFDLKGEGTGKSNGTYDIASDPTSGNLYVTEGANNRVQEFSASGSFIASFGSAGSGSGQFSGPEGVAVSSAGTVYVADSANNRVEEWAPGKGAEPPTYTTSLTSYENTEINFKEAHAVAVDPSGNIFVADSGHSRIVEFNAARKYVRQFGEAGTGVGQFSAIGGIATNAAGDLYVTDSPNNRVEEFGPTGEYIRTFGSSFLASGQLLYPGAVAVDSSGNVWVLNPYGASTAGHVVEFSSSGSFLSKFGASGSAEGQLGTAFGLAFSGGHLYVSEAANSRVQEFSTAGAFIAQFDLKGEGTGKSNGTYDIASDPTSGNLYVTEGANNRVQEFSASGSFIASFGSAGSGSGQFSGPEGVAVSSAGTVYVADSANNRVEEWALR